MGQGSRRLGGWALFAGLLACSAPPPVTDGPGSPTLRRLSRAEYFNTVRDLLGVTVCAAGCVLEPSLLAPDDVPGGFASTIAAARVSPLLLDQYRSAAEAIAAAAVERLAPVLACAGDDRACLKRVVEELGRRAFRRPLAAEEVASYLALHASAEGADGLRTVLEALLQSPHFLYRVEVGKPTSWQVATRLSYFLWASMPDEELFAAARQGKLGRPEEVAAQAARMLRDRRARDGLHELFRQWLGLSHLETLVTHQALLPAGAAADELFAAMREQLFMFVDSVVMDGDGTIATLLTSPRSFSNASLAPLYGRADTQAGLVAVDLDPAERAGILTHPAVLAVTSHDADTSPTMRGKSVREQWLCQPLPPPPPGDAPRLPPKQPTQTVRERYRTHIENAICASCHALMDPIGFGFESYDSVGRFRAVGEDGRPVDASGELIGSDVDGPFVGVVELARKLARSEQVRRCLTSAWFELAFGREAEPRDAATVEAGMRALAATGGDLRALIVALASTPAFFSGTSGGRP
jgi:hypothetical protein